MLPQGGYIPGLGGGDLVPTTSGYVCQNVNGSFFWFLVVVMSDTILMKLSVNVAASP